MSESKVPRIITADEIRVGQKIAVDRFLRRANTIPSYGATDNPEVETATGFVEAKYQTSVLLQTERGRRSVPVVFGADARRVIASEITLLEEPPGPKSAYDPEKHVFIDKTTAYAASNTYAQHVANDGYRYAADLIRATAKAYKEQVGD